MKIQIVGLGQLGMCLAELLLEFGHDVVGIDLNESFRPDLEELGVRWGDEPAEIRLLAIFPWQVKSVPEDGSLVVNLSSVQETGILCLKQLGVHTSRLMSLHTLFGPALLSQSGWSGKQVVVTLTPNDPRANALLKVFSDKGVMINSMSYMEDDAKMGIHAFAFFVGELVRVVMAKSDSRYLTGSGHHLVGLLNFIGETPDLTRHILSNPALKNIWPGIMAKILELEKEFGWGVTLYGGE